MKIIDTRIDIKQQAILASLIGKTVSTVEHAPFAFTNTVSQVVRINIEGESPIFIYCFTEPMDYYGSEEEVSILSVEDMEYPFVSKKDFISIPVNQSISAISIVEENQKLSVDEKIEYDVKLTRGIIFCFDQYQIGFEKSVWFSEDIIVRRGYALEEMFRPTSDICNDTHWADGTKMECFRTIDTV